MLERETAVANLQAEVVRSEQMVLIAAKNALAAAEKAKGEAARVKLEAQAEAVSVTPRAQAQAEATRMSGEAQAVSERALGHARSEAYRAGVQSLGESGYATLQLAQTLGEHHMKLVPDVALTGDGGSGSLASVFMARMLVPRPAETDVATAKQSS